MLLAVSVWRLRQRWRGARARTHNQTSIHVPFAREATGLRRLVTGVQELDHCLRHYSNHPHYVDSRGTERQPRLGVPLHGHPDWPSSHSHCACRVLGSAELRRRDRGLVDRSRVRLRDLVISGFHLPGWLGRRPLPGEHRPGGPHAVRQLRVHRSRRYRLRRHQPLAKPSHDWSGARGSLGEDTWCRQHPVAVVREVSWVNISGILSEESLLPLRKSLVFCHWLNVDNVLSVCAAYSFCLCDSSFWVHHWQVDVPMVTVLLRVILDCQLF